MEWLNPESVTFDKSQPLASRRLWNRAKKKRSGCWIWTGAKHDRGYGRIRWHGTLMATHRLAWALDNGQAPPAEMMVLHTCDEPSCINPKHLYLGTQADNMRDRIARNRVPRRQPRSVKQAREWIDLNKTQASRALARVGLLMDWIKEHS